MLPTFLVFCVVLLCVVTSLVPSCDVHFRIKTMFGSSLPEVVCRKALFLIHVICVCLHIVVSNKYCILFFVVVVFLRIEYPMLPVSLACPF